MGLSRKWLNVIGSRKRSSSVNTEAALADARLSRWKLWKSFLAIKRKPVCAGNKKGIGDIRKTDVVKEERAAICIQTAFRAFLAKKALRALKGLVRLQAAISGHDSRKQSAATLQCVQAFVRVQARIRRERAIQSRIAVESPKQKHGLTVEACQADSEMKWCNALGTVEEVRAKEEQKQVAALKRDRAIAYAFCNKWKSNVKVNPGSLFDMELDNSTWSWIWLDEWLNGQTKEQISGNQGQGSQRVNNPDSKPRKLVLKKSASVGLRSYLSSKVSSGKSMELKKALKREGSSGRTLLKTRPGKGKEIKVLALKPNSKLQPGHSLNQSKQPRRSLNQSKQHTSKDANNKIISVNKPK